MSDRPPTDSAKSRARAKTEQMRAERAAQAERDKRRQRIIVAVGAVVIIGLLVAIVLAVVNASGGDDEGSTRAGSDGEVVAPANVVDGAVPVGDADAPVTVDLYFDYMCPACAAFEQSNAPDLGRLVDEGTAKVHLRPMNFLDPRSNGTDYSTRAANAMATVADQAPESVWDFHNALYANLPSEGTDGLSDDQIAEIAVEAGVPEDVADSFEEGTHDAWVAQSNEAAGQDGVSSTPTVKINGETFEGDWSQPGTLVAAIEAAAEGE